MLIRLPSQVATTPMIQAVIQASRQAGVDGKTVSVRNLFASGV